MFDSGMTNEQFNSHLETLAKLIEATAKTVEDAAQIVRDAKIKKSAAAHTESVLNFETDNLAVPEVHVEEKIMDKIEEHKDF